MEEDQKAKLETLLREMVASKWAVEMLKDIVRHLSDPVGIVKAVYEEWK